MTTLLSCWNDNGLCLWLWPQINFFLTSLTICYCFQGFGQIFWHDPYQKKIPIYMVWYFFVISVFPLGSCGSLIVFHAGRVILIVHSILVINITEIAFSATYLGFRCHWTHNTHNYNLESFFHQFLSINKPETKRFTITWSIFSVNTGNQLDFRVGYNLKTLGCYVW